MDRKLLLIFVILTLVCLAQRRVDAAFGYDRTLPEDPEVVKELGFKCVPGRTIIKLESKPKPEETKESSYEDDMRRSHMNTNINEEYCKICVCSVEGKDVFCQGRPAMNVNECIKMAEYVDQFNRNEPFSHDRILSYRVRRDYIWHDDEIPYDSRAKCRRSHSFYTNNINANNTDIDLPTDVENELDYPNSNICFYCICTVDGTSIACIPREAVFCQYFQSLRDPNKIRQMYNTQFEQERPTYFRQLSYRLRRAMDNSVYEIIDNGNVLAKNNKCIPFVSQYTDCTEENRCSGCSRCTCIAAGQWSCTNVKDCPALEDEGEASGEDLDTVQNDIDFTIDSIQNRIQDSDSGLGQPFYKPQPKQKQAGYVPAPFSSTTESDLIETEHLGFDIENKIAEVLGHSLLKRSIDKEDNKTQSAVKFHDTVDEFNEDTLKNNHSSGTIIAKTFDALNLPKISRRTGLFASKISDNESLHIEYNQPKIYDHQIADNKIDLTAHTEDKLDVLARDKIHKIIGNHTQKQKDKELSKLVVNELNLGTEIIGDGSGAPVLSNITFTPENDTLSAMAFIAGNLLNKLWNIEKDSNEESVDTEALKHEKISDLLDLFKQPLNLRQETFLKNALEQLTDAIDKDKVLENVSLCEKFTTLNLDNQSKNNTDDGDSRKYEDIKNKPKKIAEKEITTEDPSKAISKMKDVLQLISKFKKIEQNLNSLKSSPDTDNTTKTKKSERKSGSGVDVTSNDSESLNTFGNILRTITKLLLPPKKSKKINSIIKNQQVFNTNSNDLITTLKSLYGVNLDNSSLTAKDKIIFDYLTSVNTDSHCLFKHYKMDSERGRSTNNNIEGNIILNLSEFFKIKSFVDLIKLLEPERNVGRSRPDITVGTTISQILIESTTVSSNLPSASVPENNNNLATMKEKIKTHLKTLIDDLSKLQIAKGLPLSKINIEDTLPCIYNLLNVEKENTPLQYRTFNNLSVPEKVTEVLTLIKNDIKGLPSRRSGVAVGPKSKSAEIFERIVNDYKIKSKPTTRRTMVDSQPQTYEQLKVMIDQIESGSLSYKSQALRHGTAPPERLVLLKTLSKDVDAYMKVLEGINNSLPLLTSISRDKQNDLIDFVYNAKNNLNLNKKILQTINKPYKNEDKAFGDLNIRKEKMMKGKPFEKQQLRIPDAFQRVKNIKLTRDDIINQLIKNRILLYMNMKEARDVDLSDDFNYSVAKKIIEYMERGNYNLARNLYNVIIAEVQNKGRNSSYGSSKGTASNVNSNQNTASFDKEPLIKFEDSAYQNPRVAFTQNQIDVLLRRMSNLKNIRP